ncbi:hypothetical protein M422DRAFT_783650 [Sphaerobolus stellatus SS14]|uniref:Protein kinase domain-containing protein n=1 Tax=Sphaerobolus stellatus (strain SS14) TaxID=990650 RepID=A0A0C9UBJ1_SPHS4|nr:hypothetical protein M422DRAFT_783650 [Sphaerobolus stellatus SS14]
MPAKFASCSYSELHERSIVASEVRWGPAGAQLSLVLPSVWLDSTATSCSTDSNSNADEHLKRNLCRINRVSTIEDGVDGSSRSRSRKCAGGPRRYWGKKKDASANNENYCAVLRAKRASQVGFTCAGMGGSPVRCFTSRDILIGKQLGAGGNGAVYLTQIKSAGHHPSYHQQSLAIIGALKFAHHHNPCPNLQSEAETLEYLSAFIPNNMVPYLGRVYSQRSLHLAQRYHSDPTNSHPPGLPAPLPLVSGILLKFMPAGDFRSLLRHLSLNYSYSAKGSVHPHIARYYLISLLRNLFALHHAGLEHGYYHGDVKPDNIMMSEEGKMLLSDFGASRPDRENVWRGRYGGTVAYLAPEYFEGDYLCGESYGTQYIGSRKPGDLWSAGIMALDMVFRFTPYQGKSVEAIYSNLLNFLRDQSYPAILREDLLEAEMQQALMFIKKLLRFSPYDRPSWTEIINDPWIHDEWVLMERGSVPAPLLYRDGKWAPTHEWEHVL